MNFQTDLNIGYDLSFFDGITVETSNLSFEEIHAVKTPLQEPTFIEVWKNRFFYLRVVISNLD